MRHFRHLAALATTALSLAAAPAALAQTTSVGNANGSASMNICLAQINCTYVNYQHGKPTDVVKRTGTLVDWSLNAGSVGGQVQLRILRPTTHGAFKVIRSSAVQTVSSTGINVFSANLKVRRGDVLALSNATSGIYMASAPAGTCVRYFMGPLNDGQSMKPSTIAPQLHLLISAHVKG
ncbi:MAG TPA: hypothetical protein VMU39_02330 [Solirubrobacteraceae bacterium]|nr:hypothetical protein [Solirubrobacteraceae bacterium]